MKIVKELLLSAGLLGMSTLAMATSGNVQGPLIGYAVTPYDDTGSSSPVDYGMVVVNDSNYTDSSAPCYVPYVGFSVIYFKLDSSVRGQAEYSSAIAAFATGAIVKAAYTINAVGNCEINTTDDYFVVH